MTHTQSLSIRHHTNWLTITLVAAIAIGEQQPKRKPLAMAGGTRNPVLSQTRIGC